MDDLRLSYSHWGMHSCYTYPLLQPIRCCSHTPLIGWPMMYCGDNYDAKYLHG